MSDAVLAAPALAASLSAIAVWLLLRAAPALPPDLPNARSLHARPVPRAYGYSVEDTDAVAYCSRRFRSYNPETGTYIAAGGVVRACP